MTTYALIRRNLTDTGERSSTVIPIPPDQLHIDKPYWVPIEYNEQDTSTPGNLDRVVGPWSQTVLADKIVKSRTIRDKTPAELSQEKAQRVDQIETSRGPDKAFFNLIFNMVNDIRALKTPALPPMTLPQFKALLRDNL